ncbi:MAG: ribonuclease Z [Cytophagales bacterium]|nr:MAG: ribonuclease Z [Cytophagales bacterium]
MQFELKILGANSANPVYNRHQTAQFLQIEPYNILIDCGEATQHQMLRFKVKIIKIDYIFISHLHGDHYFGLIGLISTMHLQGRTNDLYLYGPSGLEEIITIQLKWSETILNYKIIFRTLNASKVETILENDKFTVETIPLNHRIPACGFLFKEKPKRRRINKDKFPPKGSLAHMAMLKQGLDVIDEQGNILYNNEEFTLAPKKSRSYAFCSDTRPMTSNIPQLKDIDLLYHEATFMDNMQDRAITTFHSTAKEAAQFALDCNVQRLIIGHYSSRYKTIEPLLEEAKLVFENTDLALEGKSYFIEE